MVSESWFRSLWKLPRQHESGHDKAVIGVLAFEVASLMSKLVHLWQSLSDKQIVRMREEITNSVGIRKLVSEDEDFIAGLIRAEMMESTENIAQSVARLSKKCNDPSLRNFDTAFNELIKIRADPYGWEFSGKKMDRKVKKMERFILVNASLYQEMEILADLEQTFKRMKCSESEPETLLEFQKKVSWKQHEVKSLREISLWSRTYDYTVLLLARSIFTISNRIRNVFGISHAKDLSRDLHTSEHDFIGRSHSVSGFLQSKLHQPGTGLPRFASGPIGRYSTTAAPVARSTKMGDFLSISLASASPTPDPIVEKGKRFKFYSGPLGKLTSKSGPLVGLGKTDKRQHSKPNRLTQVGPFKGCMVADDCSAVGMSIPSKAARYGSADQVPRGCAIRDDKLVSQSRPKLLEAPPDTLGAACLALHYANVIIVIEKFVASPHLIGDDARDDLYNMLPASVRSATRRRLKPYAKSLDSAVHPALAKDWAEHMAGILEWLTPLAHNMIRWQSERSYEQQNMVSRTNIVLVQTLYFANQVKTEETITELLVGLNYVWRYHRELNAKALQECTGGLNFDKCLESEVK